MLPDGGARPTSGPAAGAQRGRPAAKRLPRLGFLKGAALGVVVVLPTVAAGVWVLARAGIGNPAVTMVEALRMATVFAGIAAVLTAGGIGRLAAHASVTPGGVRTAVIRAARAQAIASAGLVIIAAIPHGELPADPWTWSWFAAAGLIGGALSGVIIGLVCGAPVDERLPTVAELARMIPSLLPVAGEVGRARPARPGEVTATVTATVKAPPAPAVDEPAAAATAAPCGRADRGRSDRARAGRRGPRDRRAGRRRRRARIATGPRSRAAAAARGAQGAGGRDREAGHAGPQARPAGADDGRA
jgi:hypothetical protein